MSWTVERQDQNGWMRSKDSNLERGLQRRSSYQLLHFPVRLEHFSRTVFLAGEVRLELTRERLQRRCYEAKTWLRQDFGMNGSGLPIGPLPNVVERPGIEPGFSVLQTDARTIYAISRGSRNRGIWLRRLVPPHIMVAAVGPAAHQWLRRRESNSRGEVMSLAVSPDTRHIKEHRPGRISRDVC